MAPLSALGRTTSATASGLDGEAVHGRRRVVPSSPWAEVTSSTSRRAVEAPDWGRSGGSGPRARSGGGGTARRGGQGADGRRARRACPDLSPLCPERDDHHHEVALCSSWRARCLKPRRRRARPPPSSASSVLTRRRRRAQPPPPTPTSLPPRSGAARAGGCRGGGGPERGDRARERKRERRGVEGESCAGDTIATGSRR